MDCSTFDLSIWSNFNHFRNKVKNMENELWGILAYAAINVINALTSHWSEKSGVAKVFSIITEALSFIGSKGQPNVIKLPGQVQKKN